MNYEKIINQIADMSLDGTFGVETKNCSEAYQKIPNGIPRLIIFLNDFISGLKDDELSQAKWIFLQILIVTYRECKKCNPQIAEDALGIFMTDYPSTNTTAIVPKWDTLLQSILAFKNVSVSGNYLIVAEQSKKLFLAYNEFINSILPVLIIQWKTIRQETFDVSNIFLSTYSSRAEQFYKVTDGETGIFYLLHRIIRPQIRNAAAHGNLSYDRANQMFYYVDGTKKKTNGQLSLDEFMGLNALGSNFAQAYIASVCATLIFECNAESLPSKIKELFEFIPK